MKIVRNEIPKSPSVKKPKKIIPYSPKWNREAGWLARDYLPNIYPCHKCGHPVVSGYVCTFCGDSNPEHSEEDEKKL